MDLKFPCKKEISLYCIPNVFVGFCWYQGAVYQYFAVEQQSASGAYSLPVFVNPNDK